MFFTLVHAKTQMRVLCRCFVGVKQVLLAHRNRLGLSRRNEPGRERDWVANRVKGSWVSRSMDSKSWKGPWGSLDPVLEPAHAGRWLGQGLENKQVERNQVEV